MHNINNTNNAQFDDKNPPASPRIFAFGFFAENRYICTVMARRYGGDAGKTGRRRKTMQKDGRRCGNRHRKSVTNRWYTLGLQMCRSTFIRTKEPFSEAPFLLPVRRKRGKPTVYHHFAKASADSPNRKRKAVCGKLAGARKGTEPKNGPFGEIRSRI